MPIRLRFGYDEEDLLDAQWELLDAFTRQLHQGWAEPAARQALRAATDALARDPAGPTATATLLADRLVARVAELLAAQDPNALQAAQAECTYLQRQIERYQADPLTEQVIRVAQERDTAMRKIDQQARRIADLETALAQAQTARAGMQQRLQAEVARLEEEVAALNRIVAAQHEQLTAAADAENPPRKKRG